MYYICNWSTNAGYHSPTPNQRDRRLIPMHQSGVTYLSECGYPICNYMFHIPLGSFSLDQERFLPGGALSRR